MGTRHSTPAANSSLLQPSMEGDCDRVKQLVGEFLASYSSNHVGHCTDDPKLLEYVNQGDAQGNAAMHGAAFAGHLHIVQYLHESCGASLHASNHLGCHPLWLAAGYNRIDVLEYLLEKSHDDVLRTNTTGDSCLLAAASRGHVEVCQILMDLERKLLHVLNKGGDGPLSVAIAGGHSNVIHLLLPQTDISIVNQPNLKGVTPLLVACEQDNVELFDALLRNGASVDVCDRTTGATPLAVAAFCGSQGILPKLLEMHPSLLEVPNSNGCTPLWLATRAGRDNMVRLLLSSGADPVAKNKDGLSPIDVAVKYKREKVSEMFSEFYRTGEVIPLVIEE